MQSLWQGVRVGNRPLVVHDSRQDVDIRRRSLDDAMQVHRRSAKHDHRNRLPVCGESLTYRLKGALNCL